MYKLIELAGKQDAEALSLVLKAMADGMIDWGYNKGSCCVSANKSGHILIGISEEEKDWENGTSKEVVRGDH